MKRETWIDELRGFGILWVVLGHTIERAESGLNYTNSTMHFFDVFANSIHIYILFLVSGFVYGIIERPKILDGRESLFLKKKTLDLLLPYIYFGIIIWGGKMIFAKYVAKPMSFDDLYMMFVTPIAFAWYLYVLFIIIAIVYFTDKLTKGNYIVLKIIAVVFLSLQIIFTPSNVTISKVLHNMLLFVTGVILANNMKIVSGLMKLLISGVIFAILTIVHFHYDNVWILLDATTHFWGALFFLQLFYQLRHYENKFLIKIGKFTIYIYLLHPLVINFFKAIYLIMNIDSIAFWLVTLFFTGVAIPLFYAILTNKYNILEIPFKPRKYLMREVKK